MQTPIILFLSSTSFHFPLDLHGILANEGGETKRYESIDDFLSTPDRHTPYVAVLEIGSTEDVDRALLAYEWCEQIQPIAPCRTILLIASKNISLGDRAARFGNAEVAHLPLPLKNLLFKIDLQKRLLAADQAQAAAERGKAAVESSFSASFVERPPKLDRVLLVRGPGPKKGYWQEAAESPSGKIRWRWVSTQKPEDQTPAEKAGVTWAADSRVKPVYEEATESWAIEDPEADLIGFRKDKPIFSARTSNRLPPVERVGDEKRGFGSEKKSAEPDRAFAKEAKTGAVAERIDAKTAAPTAARTIEAGQENSPAKGEEKFSQASAPVASAREFKAGTQPVASAQQKFQPGESKPVPSAVQTRAGADAPEWQQRAAPAKAAARPGISRSVPPGEAAAPAEKAKPGREAEAEPPAEAAPEDSIPEQMHEEEPEDHSGYSVPVSSEVERKTGEIERPPLEESYSARAPEHPHKEAEYSATEAPAQAEPAVEESITEIKARRRAEAEAAAAAKAKRAAEQEVAAKAMARPEEVVAAALEKLAAQRKQWAEAQSAPAPAGKTKPEPAPAVPTVAPPVETQVPAAEPSRTETVARAAGQVSAPAKEEIKIKADPEPEQIKSEIALDGTPDHSGEEIRIRARAEGDSSHLDRPEKAPGENPLKLRHFVTMTLEELNDRDSSWHPMHRYRIYLSASHRYYRVKDPAALLPLWVYEGELAPEFLEDKKAWKFYDRYPELYSTLDTLPPVVLDQIYVMAGRPPPGADSVSQARAVAAIDELTHGGGAPVAGHADAEQERRGIWGSVKSFFKRIFGG